MFIQVHTSFPTQIPHHLLNLNFGYTELDINSSPTTPYHSAMEAYWSSKALSRLLTHSFLTSNPKSHFEIVNLLPTVVIGPDELATSTSELLTAMRVLAMGPLLGQKIESPMVGVQVHVDDVARAHVDALNSRVPGNRDYVLSSDGIDGIVWDDVKVMFKGEGKLKLDGSMPTIKWRLDVSSTEKAFGWKCKSFEETMRGLVGQYLELLQLDGENRSGEVGV